MIRYTGCVPNPRFKNYTCSDLRGVKAANYRPLLVRKPLRSGRFDFNAVLACAERQAARHSTHATP